jgi:hypothetical protein
MGWSSDGKEGGSDGKENCKDSGTDSGFHEEHEILCEGENEVEVFIF